MRRTDTPSCPNFLRQLKVACTKASRRTAGVERWNFGTCRLVAIYSFFRMIPQLERLIAHEGRDALRYVAPDVQIPVLHRRVVSQGMHA